VRWCSPVRAVPRPQHCAPLQKPQGPLRVRPKARNKQISTGIWYSSTTAGPHSLLRRAAAALRMPGAALAVVFLQHSVGGNLDGPFILVKHD
jgi:hypothetical protein